MRSRIFLPSILATTLMIVFLFQACGYLGGSKAQMLSISEGTFASVRTAVFDMKCTSCHSGATPSAGYDLSTYDGVMSGGRVIPYEPQNSLLLQKMKDGSMPPGGGLSSNDIAAVEEWILSGAPATGSSDPQPTPIPESVPPTASAGSDKSVSLPQNNYSIFGSAEDTDGLVVSVQWQKLSGPTVTLQGANTLTLTLNNISAGSYIFELTVTDNDGLTSSDSMQLDVVSQGSGGGGSGGNSTPTPSPSPTPNVNSNATFTWIKTNILSTKCQSCHGTTPSGGYDVRTYSSTLKKVVPGNSAASALYTAVSSGSMPKNGSKLSATQIQEIKDWIDSGAPNN
jgi:hypothetical protein